MKKIKQLEPMEIEKRSFEIISHELSEMQITLPADQEMITKRVIHTSADFDYIQTLKYSKDAVAIAKRLISEGADIVTDTNMALSGISAKTLQYLMGHSDISITLNVYTHIKFDNAQKEVELVQQRQQKEMENVRKELEQVGAIRPKIIPFKNEA